MDFPRYFSHFLTWLNTHLYCFQVFTDSPLLALSESAAFKLLATFQFSKISVQNCPTLSYLVFAVGFGDTGFPLPEEKMV